MRDDGERISPGQLDRGDLALVLALGAVIMVVVDLDRPRDGFIQVSQQPLMDLERQIGPPSP